MLEVVKSYVDFNYQYVLLSNDKWYIVPRRLYAGHLLNQVPASFILVDDPRREDNPYKQIEFKSDSLQGEKVTKAFAWALTILTIVFLAITFFFIIIDVFYSSLAT